MKKEFIDINDARNQLRSYFISCTPEINLNDLNELLQEFTLHQFSKKEKIILAGEGSSTFYFVCKGLIRIYYEKEEKEITNYFIKENMVFAVSAHLSGKKNINNYEASEDTTVLRINLALLESYFTKSHSLEHLARKLIETNYGAFMKKTHDVLFLSAEERYDKFLNEHSDLINRLPLRIIASYLGITQETLSRLRSKY